MGSVYLQNVFPPQNDQQGKNAPELTLLAIAKATSLRLATLAYRRFKMVAQ